MPAHESISYDMDETECNTELIKNSELDHRSSQPELPLLEFIVKLLPV